MARIASGARPLGREEARGVGIDVSDLRLGRGGGPTLSRSNRLPSSGGAIDAPDPPHYIPRHSRICTKRQRVMSLNQAAVGELSERSREILRTIVEAYVETGEPVGSRTISRKLGLTLSPATIRNVMADLEDSGLLYA